MYEGIFVVFFHEQSHSECALLQIAVYRDTECLPCSAAQHHRTFTVPILYKLYSLQLD